MELPIRYLIFISGLLVTATSLASPSSLPKELAGVWTGSCIKTADAPNRYGSKLDIIVLSQTSSTMSEVKFQYDDCSQIQSFQQMPVAISLVSLKPYLEVSINGAHYILNSSKKLPQLEGQNSKFSLRDILADPSTPADIKSECPNFSGVYAWVNRPANDHNFDPNHYVVQLGCSQVISAGNSHSALETFYREPDTVLTDGRVWNFNSHWYFDEGRLGISKATFQGEKLIREVSFSNRPNADYWYSFTEKMYFSDHPCGVDTKRVSHLVVERNYPEQKESVCDYYKRLL